MALSNYERVGKAMELLRDGLQAFVERELKAQHSQQWFSEAKGAVSPQQANLFGSEDAPRWDAAVLLSIMWNQWNLVFRKTLGPADRSIVSELREVRNRWAHQNQFSGDDAYRALDSIGRLLTAVSAPQADEVEKMKMDLLRVRFDEQMRTEKRKTAGTTIETQVSGALKPWREVINPHKDVASGRYQQAEFAADLWQVHLGEGSDEYRNPKEFFRRTFLTESLNQLLVGAVRRVSGTGGDPVVQLQTNFGGGKTHSMLALYHLFSGTAPGELLGVDAILKAAEVTNLPTVKAVVLVGNKISPGNPSTKPDGTVVRTLWGEMAWQLGGKKAYARIKADDEKATNPGDVLRQLFTEFGPCLILIDEWVAYARQLHDQSDLPAGSFETQFSFAQALTESAKLANNCLLVISLPASDSSASPHAQADDVEVGGQRGREALDRLRNVIGRVESSWRPASAVEGFEIVRRRLFEPLIDREQWVARDTVARAFADFYRAQSQEFPPECKDADYENRLKAAYPIHPEIFDRLYSDWSTLLKFQRTRGVLRLMAAVIHSLWEKGDKNPLILPSNLPIDDRRVQFELTRYLSDNWTPVIEKDVDGPNSLPLRLDGEVANLGRLSACRRVARTIYLGSAPTTDAANRGIEDRRVKLGCAMPGESVAIFGDAMRRLASTATYLFQDGARYWYDTQPTVTKLAEDRAEQLKRESDKVVAEIEDRVKSATMDNKGDFRRVHPFPVSGQDVSDEREARLVVLGVDHPHSSEPESAAKAAAKAILASRGNSPRIYQNTLVFLAVDKTRLQDLDEAVRKFLAWESIVAEKESLNLDPHQLKQAETQKKAADGTVTARLPEAYQWLLVPKQASPQSPMEWETIRLSGSEALAVRASRRLRTDESLLKSFGAARLKMELDRVPLWRGDHVPIRQLAEDFARYVYLPRLVGPEIMADAVRGGLEALLWEQDSFAYAERYDEAAGRYAGLSAGRQVYITDADDAGLLVKAAAARTQLDIEVPPAATGGGAGNASGTGTAPTGGAVGPNGGAAAPTSAAKPQPKRFFGSIELDPNRPTPKASQVAEEVVAHLVGLPGSTVRITMEIEADIPGGVPENVVRIVTENSQSLKFGTHGFDKG